MKYDKEFFENESHYAIQALLAGNFINMALFIALLAAGDIEGQHMVFGSWLAAYFAALTYRHEWVAFCLGLLCLTLTAFASFRWLLGLGV